MAESFFCAPLVTVVTQPLHLQALTGKRRYWTITSLHFPAAEAHCWSEMGKPWAVRLSLLASLEYRELHDGREREEQATLEFYAEETLVLGVFRYELGNGSLGKRTFPIARSLWPLFTHKQLGFWHDFRKGVLVKLSVYSRSVLLGLLWQLTARNNARVWYIVTLRFSNVSSFKCIKFDVSFDSSDIPNQTWFHTQFRWRGGERITLY